MIEIALHRSLSWNVACSDARQAGRRELRATDGEIKAPTSVALIWLGEWKKWGLASNRQPTFSPKRQVNQHSRRHPLFRFHGEHDETARR
jgi:hypothetical protein